MYILHICGQSVVLMFSRSCCKGQSYYYMSCSQLDLLFTCWSFMRVYKSLRTLIITIANFRHCNQHWKMFTCFFFHVFWDIYETFLAMFVSIIPPVSWVEIPSSCEQSELRESRIQMSWVKLFKQHHLL